MGEPGKEHPIETPGNKAFSWDGEKTVKKLKKKRGGWAGSSGVWGKQRSRDFKKKTNIG